MKRHPKHPKLKPLKLNSGDERATDAARQSLPNPVAVAALEGMLDAMMKPVADAGTLSQPAVGALRSVFAMLLGTAAAEKEVVLEVEGQEPIKIRKQDAQAVGIRGLVDLTRAEVAHMLERKPSNVRLKSK
jgi:hypothetical protein